MYRSYMIRLFKRKRVLILLTITFIINFLNFYLTNNSFTYVDKIPVQSAWNMNLMITGNFYLAGLLYSFLVYPIAALAFSDMIVEDKNSGYINQILTKISYKKYIKSVYIMNFIMGGLFALFPLFINLISWMMVRPMFPMNYMTVGLTNVFFGIRLMLISPVIYFLFISFIIFIIGGIISSFALFIDTLLNNSYIGLFIVMVIDILVTLGFYFISIILKTNIAITNLGSFIINRIYSSLFISIVYIFVMALIPIIYFYKLSKKEIIV